MEKSKKLDLMARIAACKLSLLGNITAEERKFIDAELIKYKQELSLLEKSSS